jgi:hypothetical protein
MVGVVFERSQVILLKIYLKKKYLYAFTQIITIERRNTYESVCHSLEYPENT